MIIWDAPAVYLTQIFIHFGKEKKKSRIYHVIQTILLKYH